MSWTCRKRNFDLEVLGEIEAERDDALDEERLVGMEAEHGWRDKRLSTKAK